MTGQSSGSWLSRAPCWSGTQCASTGAWSWTPRLAASGISDRAQKALAPAIANAIGAGEAFEPTPQAELPGPFDLPDVDPWDVVWKDPD